LFGGSYGPKGQENLAPPMVYPGKFVLLRRAL
jgi:hypothetical protein